MIKSYSFVKEHTKRLFSECLWQQLITLLTPQKLDEIDKIDESNYYPYHDVLGHCIKDNFILKKYSQIVNSGQWGKYEEILSKTTLQVENNLIATVLFTIYSCYNDFCI